MRERPADKRRKSHVLRQGDYMFPGTEVAAGVPSLFGPLPKGVEANRLSLAKWLVARQNPLTAGGRQPRVGPTVRPRHR